MAAEKVRKRDGTTQWRDRVQINGRRQWVYADTKSELQAEIADLKRKKRRRRLGLAVQPKERGEITLTDLANRMLDQYAKSAESKQTLDYNLNYWRGPAAPFGRLYVRELDVEELAVWLARLDVAPQTRRNALKALRQVLTYGVKHGWLTENVALKVEMPEEEPSIKRPLEDWPQVFSFAAAFEWPMYRALVRFVCATGLRPQEWQALRDEDIDRANRVLHIRRTVRGRQIVEGKAKTPGSLRSVELQKIALDALATLPPVLDRKQLRFTDHKGRMIDLDRFAGRNGKPGPWRKALASAGLEYRDPYAMRDTFATLAWAGGASVEWIAKQMGHVDKFGNPRPQTTLKHYAKCLPAVDRRNVAFLDTFAVEQLSTRPKVDTARADDRQP